jgi:diacylglycerol O-acyltransferase
MPAHRRDADLEMSPFDALLYRGDEDPATRSLLVATCLLENTPTREAFAATVDRASRVVRRLRQRVVPAPVPFVLPLWSVDPDFDLDYHVRFERAAGDGTLGQLIGRVQQEVARPLDQARPLWEMTLIEGLEHGRSAVLIKMSHAISDGVGIVKLFSALFDQSPRPERGALPPPPIPEDLTPDDVMNRALRRLPRTTARALLSSSVRTLSVARRVTQDPVPALRDATAYLDSVRRVLAAGGRPSELLAGRSLKRRCLAFDMPLARMKQAGQRLDASINDVYLAGIVAALRRYHLEMGVAPAPLPIAIPVNLRSEDDAAAGNRFGVVMLAAPVNVDDPMRRIAMIREQVRTGRGERAVGAPGDLAGVFARLPDWLRTRIAASAPKPDIQASNVPGSPVPIFLAGSRVEKLYAFGPVPGVAAMFALQSLAGTCYVGVNLDAAAITDQGLLASCIEEGFEELLATGRRGGKRPVRLIVGEPSSERQA